MAGEDHSERRIQGLLVAGESAAALELAEDWLKSAPEDPAAWFNTAVCRHVNVNIDGALEAFDEVLRRAPGHVQALSGRGGMLARLGRQQAALESYDQALQVSPEDPDLHHNRALVLEHLDRLPEALEAYAEALHLNSQYLPSLPNQSLLLARLQRFEEALAQARDLAAGFGDQILAHINLAEIELRASHYPESLAACECALEIEADHAGALVIQVIALAALGRLREAGAALVRARRLDPAVAAACCRNLLGEAAAGPQALEPADIWFRSAWQRLGECDWRHYPEDAALAGRLFTAGDQGLAALTGAHYCQPLRDFAVDDGVRRQHALHYTRQLQQSLQPQVFIARDSGEDQRLRLAYLIADPAAEPLWSLILPVLQAHRHQDLHITIYCLTRIREQPLLETLCAGADACADLSTLSDREAAFRIYQDRNRILVALSAHGDAARPAVMAYRPAPLQVWYPGHSGTSGAPWIDYALVDRHCSGLEDRPYWTEQRALLPAPAIALSTAECVSEAIPRATLGLPAGQFVFCCFNRPEKIEPLVFDVWMRMLLRIPNSLLWLQAWNQAQVSRLLAEADFRGVSAERLRFALHEPDRGRHLAQLAAADLYLDTPLNNGFIRVTDALLAGLPALVCKGRDVCGRRAAALLKTLGLEELVCGDLAAYETLAVALVEDPGRLQALRAKLLGLREHSRLFDPRRQAEDLEAAYRRMWDIHESTGMPEEFCI